MSKKETKLLIPLTLNFIITIIEKTYFAQNRYYIFSTVFRKMAYIKKEYEKEREELKWEQSSEKE